MFTLCEHTADLGIAVSAASLDLLMADAASGLVTIIAGDLAQIRPLVEESFTISGSDPAWLLFDWLREVHAAFELRRMLLSRFDVAITTAGLQARARGERYDPGRHTLAHEVKAITQHALEVRQTAAGWEAFCVVDI
jgi:SHS2 domain-containing protein